MAAGLNTLELIKTGAIKPTRLAQVQASTTLSNTDFGKKLP
tara:strand:- start:162 stop:284 length:123 start_codon:yes stop_codon:yes gene_type:complete